MGHAQLQVSLLSASSPTVGLCQHRMHTINHACRLGEDSVVACIPAAWVLALASWLHGIATMWRLCQSYGCGYPCCSASRLPVCATGCSVRGQIAVCMLHAVLNSGRAVTVMQCHDKPCQTWCVKLGVVRMCTMPCQGSCVHVEPASFHLIISFSTRNPSICDCIACCLAIHLWHQSFPP
jgi:hypothetical protein